LLATKLTHPAWSTTFLSDKKSNITMKPIKRSFFDKLIKYSLLILLSPLIAALALWFGVAEARGYDHFHHSGQMTEKPSAAPPTTHQTNPPSVNIPTSTHQSPLSVQLGFFLPPSGVSSPWTMKFTATTFPSGSGNVVIFLEPPFTDSQILNGQFDSQLETFAVAASHYSAQVVLALGEEVNCDNSDPWGGAYPGNTVASTIAAFQHEATIVKGIAPNVKIAYSANNDSCYGQPAASAYFPGSAYVDILGVDGFDFGGQSWDSVFDHALQPLQSLGKPIWILSEGVTASDNQSQFLKDTYTGAAKYGVPVVMYFNQPPFNLSSASLSTLQSLTQ
jgi:hypothetical protein